MSQGPAEGRAGAFPGFQACLQSSRNCTVTVSPVPSRVLEDCPFPSGMSPFKCQSVCASDDGRSCPSP